MMLDTFAGNMGSLGIVFMLMGGIFALIFLINGEGFGIMRILGVSLGVLAIVGLALTMYYIPIANAEVKAQDQKETMKELQIKDLDCKSIQKYLLDSLPSDNSTTQYAHSVFDLKCKGVSLT